MEKTDDIILKLEDIHKSYGPVPAVNGISLDIRRGEFMTLLGPSGCGKSTTLRLIVGLEQCQNGEITYEGRLLDSNRKRIHVPTQKRGMGMVFQSYAIWPHMTVFENVAYPMQIRRMKRSVVRNAVHKALDMVGLVGLEERPATHLSGGQQQRVAVARALVFEPTILLLDEPFSNLDAKLREQMRIEVKELQQRLNISVVFVTHDQIEALALSDRIAVMDQGKIEQVGSPEELYLHPSTSKVRDFLGRMILLEGRVQKADGTGTVVQLKDGISLACQPHGRDVGVGDRCQIAIRPEHIEVSTKKEVTADNSVLGTIETRLFLGDRYEAQIRLASGVRVLTYLAALHQWHENQDISLMFPADKLQVWPM